MTSWHGSLDYLLSRLFRRRSKKSSKLCVTDLCEGNSPVTCEFPTQRASNTENVSIWWRHHAYNFSTLMILFRFQFNGQCDFLAEGTCKHITLHTRTHTHLSQCQCLTTPSHYLNQCWLPFSEILWHWPESNFKQLPKLIFCIMSLKVTLLYYCHISQGPMS